MSAIARPAEQSKTNRTGQKEVHREHDQSEHHTHAGASGFIDKPRDPRIDHDCCRPGKVATLEPIGDLRPCAHFKAFAEDAMPDDLRVDPAGECCGAQIDSDDRDIPGADEPTHHHRGAVRPVENGDRILRASKRRGRKHMHHRPLRQRQRARTRQNLPIDIEIHTVAPCHDHRGHDIEERVGVRRPNLSDAGQHHDESATSRDPFPQRLSLISTELRWIPIGPDDRFKGRPSHPCVGHVSGRDPRHHVDEFMCGRRCDAGIIADGVRL